MAERQFEDVIIHFQTYTPEQIELARYWWNAGRDYLTIDKATDRSDWSDYQRGWYDGAMHENRKNKRLHGELFVGATQAKRLVDTHVELLNRDQEAQE